MADPFFEFYDREEVAYGEQPSPPVRAFLEQASEPGPALDLGAGAGRDSLALAAAGYQVTAVDLSDRGLQRLSQRAAQLGVAEQIDTHAADVRNLSIEPNRYAAIIATTVLDHVPAADTATLWKKIVDGLAPRGFLYVEVHTTEDPGSDRPPGQGRNAPVSETAEAVVNYFSPNQLATWASDPQSKLRILRYEERLEWDYTHGPEHLHGKAILLAVREGFHPDWYGQPKAFPRKVGE